MFILKKTLHNLISIQAIIILLLLSISLYAIEVGEQISSRASVSYSMEESSKTKETDELNITIGVISVDNNIGKATITSKIEEKSKIVIWMEKKASKEQVSIGEFVQYTLNINNDSEETLYNLKIRDFLPKGLKYKPKSFRLGEKKVTVTLSSNGKIINAIVNKLERKSRIEALYTVMVTTDVESKEIVNNASVSHNNMVISNIATSTIELKRELFTHKGVIAGQIFNMTKKPNPTSIMGIKLYMQDGSYVVSDHNGQYHFEGVNLGQHIVQVDKDLLQEGYEVVQCQDDIKSNASPFSKFVELHHGALKRVDFCIKKTGGVKSSQTKGKRVKKDKPKKHFEDKIPKYTAVNVSKLKGKQEIIWPQKRYIPAIPSTSIAILHPKNQKIELWLNGEQVSHYNLDSTVMGKKRKKSVTLYKGVDLLEGDNLFVAHFLTKSGKKVATKKRVVHLSGSPVRVRYRQEVSTLVADGRDSPIIAVQFFDMDGYPLRSGIIGSYTIDKPYLPQSRIESLKSDPLALISRRDKFKIDSNGTAYIKLQPTSKSGEVKLHFSMKNGQKSVVKAWLKPKAREWIMVGFAEGTVGYKRLTQNQEATEVDEKFYKKGRVAFFAKGKIKGSWLLTLAYDSGKKMDEKKLDSQIDPNKYYTLYGDISHQDYEASTGKKLFVKLEKDNFTTLFGDFETGLTSTELTKYERTFTGIKSEYHGELIEGSAFISHSNQQFGRDEIQGDGTSGYYYLSKKNLILNSEQITIEVHDRYHEGIVLSEKRLRRYQDYDIDYGLGRLYFKTPIYSKDSNFNPQYIVTTYEVKLESIDGYSYGGRIALNPNDKVEIGSTFVEENQGIKKNSMIGLDTNIQIGNEITFRAEYAQSTNMAKSTKIEGSAKLVELEYIGHGVEAKTYFREQDNAFGLGQLSSSLDATRKMGLEANRKFTRWHINTAFYRDESLKSQRFSEVAEMHFGYADNQWGSSVGYRYIKTDKDEGADQLTMLLSRNFFSQRLRLSIGRDQTIGKEKSELHPTKSMIEASYTLIPEVELFGTYELIEQGDKEGTQSRMGARAKPWHGATIESSRVSEFVDDSIGVYDVIGANQRIKLSDTLSFDMGYETSKGIDGNVSDKDFVAYNAGVSYQSDILTSTIRGESREGNDKDSLNLQIALYTKATDSLGLALGGSYSKSEEIEKQSRQAEAKFALAYRPKLTKWIILSRLAYRESVIDKEDNSKLISNSFVNFTLNPRFEFSFSYGMKFLIDKMNREEHESFVNYMGLDINYDLTPKFELGLHGSLLDITDAHNQKQGAGAYIGYNIFDNAWLYLGYNFVGFQEDDFSLQNYNREGVYLRFDMKFDQESLGKMAKGLL